MAVALIDRRSAALTAPTDRLFRYDPPVSHATLRAWQHELDTAVEYADRLARCLIWWEAGDVWQPVQRFMLWLAVDPQHVTIEPWVRRALNGPHPRATGHYCGAGFCLCAMKRNKWVGGTTKIVDRQTWEIYQKTGLYATRWWTIQGHHGGHRYAWEPDELASTASRMRGGPSQTPAPGDLPYAPFDKRVIRQVLMERRAAQVMSALRNAANVGDALRAEDQAEAERVAQHVWEFMDEQAYALWHDGAELLPRYFEDQYGRMPTGSTLSVDEGTQEKREYLALHPAGI